MMERKPGGRGYGEFNKDATSECIELAKYLRMLVKRAERTQRDLQVPTGYGKSTISSFLSGQTVPTKAFVVKLVNYVTQPRQQPTSMKEALRLLAAAQRPQPAPAPGGLPVPRTAPESSLAEAALASVAATAQDQAAKAHEQLAQAHERNQELVEERGRTQQLVLSLSRFTAELQQQVTTLEDQYDEENEENEARLRQLTDQLKAAQRELRRARASRDETETLLARLRKRSDELEEELAQSRRTVASLEEPKLPEELQEAFFRADFDNALRAAEGFLNDGQQRRDEVSDEWSLLKPRQSAMRNVDRLQTGCHLLTRALGCLAMMSAAALYLAASRSGADGWKVLLAAQMLIGLCFVGDPWGPIGQLWPAFRSGFRRESMPGPITISTRSMVIRATRWGSAGLAATGAALSVQCSVQWSAWWLFPLLPATAACAGFAVLGLDQRVVRLAQELVGELGADFNTPVRSSPAPAAVMGMTSPIVVSDREWLEARRQEVGSSLTGGWAHSALWIKGIVLFSAALVGVAVVGVLANTAVHTARTWHTPKGWHWDAVVATIEQPVNAYLTAHSAGLPLPVAALHLLWLSSGAVALAMSFLFGGLGARTTWVMWGAATVVMVWSGTPGEARQVAAGLATIAWGLASILAMRGLKLRPMASQSVFVSKDS